MGLKISSNDLNEQNSLRSLLLWMSAGLSTQLLKGVSITTSMAKWSTRIRLASHRSGAHLCCLCSEITSKSLDMRCAAIRSNTWKPWHHLSTLFKQFPLLLSQLLNNWFIIHVFSRNYIPYYLKSIKFVGYLTRTLCLIIRYQVKPRL